ncbi:PIG-L deacetylase family protein [Shewanella sp. NIFS-20-20]|uniref:PIG-L deacetylase family protein n=1 Tax=Shewanella sp. NIFS-20-20 TaxID=2853806 RepID=UPI001C45CE4E|nr:PIG-L deacetylase family protein [Shewanella sp. NIFS-20-20]MBV7316390.1 PIG-L family deacetylase [Shewanella sp. NIFS-20-20]
MTHKVLVVAAHPDDEVLGCAGTLLRHRRDGDRVELLFMTNGVGSRDVEHSESQLRQQTALAAAHSLDCPPPTFLDFGDNQMDAMPLLTVVKAIEAKIASYQPDIIYTHFGDDLNIDHAVTYRAVLTACRPQPGHSVQAIYCFEVPSSTEWALQSQSAFRPQRYVDISDFSEAIARAQACYQQELRPWPHSRSVEAISALRQWRGACVGVRAAEAFMVEREIVS